ncbi:hypothetical protein W97_05611 [Coniosporium apollinis CBS 100218]|uniref:Exosome complex protein n=1 Tax=Coniosporium apollinis (strain CBS 100218) TaxID=1168221 RepID=R7YWK3_CONA1|nr:uncharacterized protein W97_05611 [Coniosporium apollinis CBS 100218]EON66218.1 hypothetical protein W97_05611 [Coniosporium apollinis CBS 100218]
MDTTTLAPLLSSLSSSIDDLQDSLAPLLTTPLSQTASKLPLLDKAKLHVLTTYAIESLLFSYLSLNGVNAKTHPIFTEIMRVKQYNEKIKLAEAGPAAINRTQTLDKSAAQRFIKSGLAGNERFDRERAERQAREKEVAREKLEALEAAKVRLQAEMTARKRKAEEIEEAEEDGEVAEEAQEEGSEEGELEPEAETTAQEDTSAVNERGGVPSEPAKKKKLRHSNDPEKKRIRVEKRAEKKVERNAAKRQKKKAKKEAKKQSG